jgi:AraC family transcriptional regulator
MRSEIERVVECIRTRYDEELSLTTLAEMARLSPFHMARLFRQETGLPPARFLATVRLEEAKKKLLSTESSVADISAEVGYSSLGTFTTRFTRSIGVSPGRYRRLGLLPTVTGFIPDAEDAPFAYGTVVGRITREDNRVDEEVFIGAFSGSLARDRPVRCCRVARSDHTWCISNVPEGRWYVEGASQSIGHGADSIVLGSVGPLDVKPGGVIEVVLSLASAAKARLADVDRHPLAFALPTIFQP